MSMIFIRNKDSRTNSGTPNAYAYDDAAKAVAFLQKWAEAKGVDFKAVLNSVEVRVAGRPIPALGSEPKDVQAAMESAAKRV